MGNKKNKKTKKLQKVNKRTLRKIILETTAKNPTKQYNYKQIASRFEIKDADSRRLISVVLNDLKKENKLEEVSKGKFRFHTKAGNVQGIIDLSKKGKAFVMSDEVEDEIFISTSNLHNSLHGDKVEVHVYARRKKSQLEGEVIRIIKRARSEFVGVIERSKNFAFLVVKNKNMPYDIFIPNNKLKGAKQGEKAIVKIVEWPDGAKSPIGEVVDVLGKSGEHNVEMHAILAEFDLPYKFPENIEKQANELDAGITPEEIKKRRDFRNIPTFTIDPSDAKDFDDALSVKKLENGNYEVGVHIADVTFYVREQSMLDNAAYERATSVYLVDRVVPMLPEKLSNNICSLRPNEDKLCYSAVFELDNHATIHNQWFGRTIINSNKRFDYDEAQMVIDTGDGDMKNEVLLLNDLAQKLRKKRFKNGAISFERTEAKFEIDKDGKPLRVYFKEAKASNHLIEEFMLLANQKVAEFIGKAEKGKKAKTFVYRVHDEPDLEKLDSFARFINKFGYSIQLSSEKMISNTLNKLLDEVKGKSEEDVVQNLAIRSMAKAEYSTKNIGHYGLAFSHYTHFTSPIRRYPDVMVHRLLEYYLQQGNSANKQRYEKMCKHSSEMEFRAVQAERASIKYKQVEFMKGHVGEQFEGIISGITEWGMYVEIEENKIEGMVALRDLDDDFYMFDEENYCLIGHYNKKTFQLGDKVKIEIARANLERKQLDFNLIME